MITVSEPDGTTYHLRADYGLIRLTRSTGWSNTTWTISAVSGRCLADSLHDCADAIEGNDSAPEGNDTSEP